MGVEEQKDENSAFHVEHLKKKKEINPQEFGYLAVPDIDLEWPKQETQKEKIWRKFKENPFVPVGLGVTAFALIYGVFNMRTGNTKVSQQMMRLRVGAQSFTVVTLLIGVAFSARESRLKREARQLEREAAMAAVAASSE